MGQQQLILLVLATVIVGIAIVVGIRAFTENSAKSNADALMQDAVRMVNDAQAWKKKPAPFGGQASTQPVAVVQDTTDFTGATFPALGYALDGNGDYTNLNGSFDIVSADANGMTLRGISLLEGNEIEVTVAGMSDNEINGVITCLAYRDPADGSECAPALP